MYRKVKSSLWHDPAVRQLSPEEKLLFVYLITNPHTHQSGLYYLPLVTIEHELGYTIHRIKSALDALSIHHLVMVDAANELVWVRNMYRHQRCGVKSDINVRDHLETLHKSFLIGDFLQFYAEWRIQYRYTIQSSHTDRERDRDREQDGDREREQGGKRPPPKGGSRSFTPPTVDQVAAYIAEASITGIDPATFCDYYQQRGWQLSGRQPMKDWQATVRNWHRRDMERKTAKPDADPYGNQAMVARMTAKITAESRQTELALDQPEMSRDDDE